MHIGHSRHDGTSPFRTLDEYLEIARDKHILAALEWCDGNRTHAAKLLGISRRSVCRWAASHKVLLDDGTNPTSET